MKQPSETNPSNDSLSIHLRRAGVGDVVQISKIINDCAEYGLMLHRSLAFLYEHVRDFHLAVEKGPTQQDRVIGVCGLSVVWANLAEVYSLAVHPQFRGKGLGKKLVLSCVEEAGKLGIAKLMTLTYEKDFFTRCGFHIIDRQQLPLKVWSECIRCAKNQACDEIAMIRVMEGIPETAVPEVPLPPAGSYEVPVTLSWSMEKRPKMDDPSK